MIQNRLHIPVTVAIASEFRYEEPVISDKSMVVFVSQSGETIDTLEALRLANKYTKKTLSIVNVKGSSIARESNYVLYTHAGPEIAVASTKAYTVQAASFYLLGCKLGLVSGKMTEADAKSLLRIFRRFQISSSQLSRRHLRLSSSQREWLTQQMRSTSDVDLTIHSAWRAHSSSKRFLIFMLRLMQQAS